MRIGLIADTHMPGALESLWPQVIEAFASVDYILHAGDLHVPQVIDDLASLAPTYAVRGNGDIGVDHPQASCMKESALCRSMCSITSSA